ncbi:MAG: hypothetical protein ABI467_11280, partial [Kofleriaceae bacterium]
MRPMVLALLLVGGCRQVFGIHDPAASDAAARDAPHLDAAVCSMAAVQCIGPDVLQTCSAAGAPAVTESCTWGCLEDPTSKRAHCGELQPAGGAVTAADLDDTPALASVVLHDATIDGTSGTITDGNGVVRSAGLGVVDGIDYELRGQVAVFRFGAVVISGATLTGPYAIALVAPGQINVPGVIDAQGPCTDKNGGPGGGAGG